MNCLGVLSAAIRSITLLVVGVRDVAPVPEGVPPTRFIAYKSCDTCLGPRDEFVLDLGAKLCSQLPPSRKNLGHLESKVLRAVRVMRYSILGFLGAMCV